MAFKKYPGYGSHVEYHTMDPKREKAADCIYLDKNRICHCEKSLVIGEKCFIASSCPHRVKSIKAKSENSVANAVKEYKSHQIKSINCTLPLNCKVHHKIWGDGNYVGYDSSKKSIRISFSGKEVSFQYPNAFTDGHLTVSELLYDQVDFDILRAKKGY